MKLHHAILTGYTMPCLEGVSTPLEMLIHHARVSSTANQFNHATGEKLFKSLIRRKEWSPLEQISLNFEVYTTRDVSQQIIRHHSLRIQEYSFRYADAREQECEVRIARLKHDTDRQKSVDVCLSDPRVAIWFEKQRKAYEIAKEAYEWALHQGIAKEVARSVLPLGITTKLYVAGTLRDFYHYCMVRCDEKTQLEHRKVAESIRENIYNLFPILREIDHECKQEN